MSSIDELLDLMETLTGRNCHFEYSNGDSHWLGYKYSDSDTWQGGNIVLAPAENGRWHDDGLSVLSDAYGSAISISRKFSDVNKNLENGWLTVHDYLYKVLTEIGEVFYDFLSELNKFIVIAKQNETTIETAINKSNEAAQQLLNELGLNNNQ